MHCFFYCHSNVSHDDTRIAEAGMVLSQAGEGSNVGIFQKKNFLFWRDLLDFDTRNSFLPISEFFIDLAVKSGWEKNESVEDLLEKITKLGEKKTNSWNFIRKKNHEEKISDELAITKSFLWILKELKRVKGARISVFSFLENIEN